MSVLGDWVAREFVPALIFTSAVATAGLLVLARMAYRRRNVDRKPLLPADPDVTAELPRVPRRRQLGMRTQLRRVVQHATSCAEAVRRAAVEAGRGQSGRW